MYKRGKCCNLRGLVNSVESPDLETLAHGPLIEANFDKLSFIAWASSVVNLDDFGHEVSAFANRH